MHAFPILDLKYVMWWVGMLLVFLENEGDGFWNSFDTTVQSTHIVCFQLGIGPMFGLIRRAQSIQPLRRLWYRQLQG